MLLERSVRSDRAPENDARLRHGRGDDIGVVTFTCDPLMEKVALRAPCFQGRLHRRRRYCQIIEAQRRLIDLELSRHLPPLSRVDIAKRGSDVDDKGFDSITVSGCNAN